MNWSSCGHYLQPDPKTDPPELQLYRIRPSLIPGTESTRVWAHILQASQVLQCSGSCCSLPNVCLRLLSVRAVIRFGTSVQ